MHLGQLLIICTSSLGWFFTFLLLIGVAKAWLLPLAVVTEPYGACVNKLYTYWKDLFKKTSKLPRKFPSACSASTLERGLGPSPVHGTDAPLSGGGIRMVSELGSKHKHSPQIRFLVPPQHLQIPARSYSGSLCTFAL